MELKITDKAPVTGAKITKEGYVAAYAKCLRTGVQDYLAKELGITDKSGIVKVYRPEEEVFHKDSLASLSHVPVTMNHPDKFVDAANWRELGVGETGSDVLRDQEWLVTSLMVKDAAAINSGLRELSAGYTATLEDAAPGSDYDYVMRNIRFNHLALVPSARAGKEARIALDAAPFETEDDNTMTLKQIVLGDAAINVAADDHSKLKDFTDAQAEKIGELTAKLADAEAKVADIPALVASRLSLIDAARKADKDVVTEGKTDHEIRLAVVTKKFGDEAVKDASEAEIAGMFKVASAAVADNGMREVIKDKAPVVTVEDTDKEVLEAANKFLSRK